MSALAEIVNDPKHPCRFKAAIEILNRTFNSCEYIPPVVESDFVISKSEPKSAQPNYKSWREEYGYTDEFINMAIQAEEQYKEKAFRRILGDKKFEEMKKKADSGQTNDIS